MKTRNLYLENSKSLGDSGTEVINLDMQDPISAINLDFGATNGATSNLGNPIVHNITKIEVVDGSDVLFSMPGHICRGLFSHLEGKVPYEYITEVPSDGPIERLYIPFGRYLYDTDYALDPTKFRNPQLKISWNLANVRAVAATGFVTSTLTYSCIARLMSEVPQPRGFLMTKDIYNFTSAASGDERVDMPTDYPYRALAVRGYESDVDLVTTITNLKLSVDGDKEIPLDIEGGNLRHMMLDMFPHLSHTIKAFVSDGTIIETWMGLSLGGQLAAGTTGYIIGGGDWWKARINPFWKLHDNSAGSSGVGWVTDVGTAFENTLVYPFGRINDPETWFDVRQTNALKLYITQGNADAPIDVALQQERNY